MQGERACLSGVPPWRHHSLGTSRCLRLWAAPHHTCKPHLPYKLSCSAVFVHDDSSADVPAGPEHPQSTSAPPSAGQLVSPPHVLDFEYTAYALLQTEQKERRRRNKAGMAYPLGARKPRQEERGYRVFEAMKGNLSAASLLYDAEEDRFVEKGTQGHGRVASERLATGSLVSPADSMYLGELLPPVEPNPCPPHAVATAAPEQTAAAMQRQQQQQQQQDRPLLSPDASLAPGISQAAPQSPPRVMCHTCGQSSSWQPQRRRGAAAGAPKRSSSAPLQQQQPQQESTQQVAHHPRQPQQHISQQAMYHQQQPQQHILQQAMYHQQQLQQHILQQAMYPQQQPQQQPLPARHPQRGRGTGMQHTQQGDVDAQEARKHCARAGRCLGLIGSSLTERPRLRGVLLQLHPPELAGERFQELQAVLGARYTVVLRIVSDFPKLLLLPEGEAMARAASVGLFMGHESPQQTSALLRATPELLTCPSPPEECMCALARALVPPLEFAELAGILAAHPSLLALHRGAAAGGANVVAVVRVLMEHMGLTKDEAVHGVVAAVPTLLQRSPGAVRRCCSALERVFQLDPNALAGVVGSAPSLLLRSPAELELVCLRVKSLLGRSKHWQAGLEALHAKPSALAHTLSFDSSRLDRLQYLSSTLRDGGIKWHVALTMPEADWLDMYSGYRSWWAKHAR